MPMGAKFFPGVLGWVFSFFCLVGFFVLFFSLFYSSLVWQTAVWPIIVDYAAMMVPNF